MASWHPTKGWNVSQKGCAVSQKGYLASIQSRLRIDFGITAGMGLWTWNPCEKRLLLKSYLISSSAKLDVLEKNQKKLIELLPDLFGGCGRNFRMGRWGYSVCPPLFLVPESLLRLLLELFWTVSLDQFLYDSFFCDRLLIQLDKWCKRSSFLLQLKTPSRGTPANPK